MSRRVLRSGFAAAGMSLLLAATVACGGDATSSAPSDALPGASGTSGTSGSAGGPRSEGVRTVGTLTDPATGVFCDGKAVRVTRDDFRITLNGTCGAVVVDASNGAINVDGAGPITVRGSKVTVLNSSAGEITVAGSDNTLNLTQAGTITVSGDRNTVLVDRLTSVLFTGSDNTVNTGGATPRPAVTDKGRGNKVV